MKDKVDIILNHTSIRAWKEQPLAEDLVENLLNVANRTSTSNGMQNASIIRIVDQEKKEAISKVCNQAYFAKAPETLIFIADNFRNTRIMEEKGIETSYSNDVDRFFQAWTDASIMAQNVASAAELQGLGIVYFGAILNDAREIINILDLPKNTFPVVGLGIGYPDQSPQLKPRMGLDKKVFVDTYKVKNNYLEDLKAYDMEMQTYYDLRNANKAVDAFTDQVVEKNKAKIAKRSELLDIIREQGFNI